MACSEKQYHQYAEDADHQQLAHVYCQRHTYGSSKLRGVMLLSGAVTLGFGLYIVRDAAAASAQYCLWQQQQQQMAMYDYELYDLTMSRLTAASPNLVYDHVHRLYRQWQLGAIAILFGILSILIGYWGPGTRARCTRCLWTFDSIVLETGLQADFAVDKKPESITSTLSASSCPPLPTPRSLLTTVGSGVGWSPIWTRAYHHPRHI